VEGKERLYLPCHSLEGVGEERKGSEETGSEARKGGAGGRGGGRLLDD